MNPPSPESKLAEETESRFFLPGELSIPTPNEESSAEHHAIARAFDHNIRAVVRTASLPLRFAAAAVHDTHWQRICSAERIRALRLEATPHETEEELTERRTKVAFESASQRIEGLLQSTGEDNIAGDYCRFLLRMSDHTDVSIAAVELLNQATVQTWASFEALARDIFELTLNSAPGLILRLIKSDVAKKRLPVKFTIESLADSGFDLSNSLGTKLLESQDFSDLRTIKACMPLLYEGAEDIIEALSDIRLWMLCQDRNVFLHRRGVIDERYIEMTGVDACVGDRLNTTPGNLMESLEAVCRGGRALIRSVRSAE